MAGTYKGRSCAKGGGGLFAKGVDALKGKGLPDSEAQAIMAKQGRAKYGKAEFQKMAAKGRARARGAK